MKVLACRELPFGAYVWTWQEKGKGNRQDYLLDHMHVGSKYGGWGFNVYDGYLPSYPIWYVPLMDSGCRRVKMPAEIGTVTQDMLDGSRCNPLFKSGWGNFNSADPTEIVVDVNVSDFTGPSWIMGLYDPVGRNTIAADPVKRNQLLAEAIPALSKPVGANLCQNRLLSENQFDMPVQFIVNGSWPRDPDPATNIRRWWHSDVDQVAYPYLHVLYDQLVSISNK